MASQSTPDALPANPDGSAADSPSHDDLQALVPDMELLESSASDALAAHAAMAASLGSSRKSTPAPKLTDRNTVTTVRMEAPKATISDDPYADLMPELEDAPAPVPAPRPVASARIPPAAAPRPQPPPPRAPAPAPAAAAPARPPAAPAPPPAPAAAAPPRPPAAANNRKLPNPSTVAVPPVMDREFVLRNRIVELYLSGSLPVRGATVFEQFCRENPKILDEIGLPERVHTGLRLLDAAGKPEPWQEKPKQFWERPYVPAALSALVVVLGILILVLNRQLSEQSRKVIALRQLVTEQPLDAATATTTLEIQPARGGPASAAATVIGGSAAQMVNVKIDLTHSDYRAFRVTIDRQGQGRVEVMNNLIKDSNGELGFSLNTSALGAGVYQLTIEGLDWRGDPQPDSWAALNIRH
jgi:hypothetical protein